MKTLNKNRKNAEKFKMGISTKVPISHLLIVCHRLTSLVANKC